MSSSKITLYIDLVSPFAYEAYYILRHNPVFKSVQCTYVPMFLGGVMKATGNTPPIGIKNKYEWIGKERNRWAKVFNIPIKPDHPPNFPPVTIYVMRVLAALTVVDSSPTTLEAAVDLLWEEFWTKHTDISKPENYEPLLATAIGEEKAKKAIELAHTEGKKLVLQNTDQAFKDGAFGLPWFVCVNKDGKREEFWGVDHIGQLIDFMGLERPKMESAWKAVL